MGERVSEPHVLVVTASDESEDILDYDIEHPTTCPRVTEPMCQWVDGELVEDWSHTFERYDCHVEYELEAIGIDELRDQITGSISGYPPEGRYEFEAWSCHYPSTPMGPEEWDSGLRLTLP